MMEQRPVITVEGEKVALGPMRRDLIPLYQAWINDVGTLRFLANSSRPLTLDEETSWYEAIINKSDLVSFTIYALPDYRPAGIVNLLHVDQVNRRCELGIMIGEPALRGNGLGTGSVRLAVDYAFHVLNLHSVMLETYEFNLAGVKAYTRAGFREIGRRREARYHAERYWDVIMMDVLVSEFDSPRLKAISAP
jgi:RimJ/RimL family protein N-acetyltransferase